MMTLKATSGNSSSQVVTNDPSVDTTLQPTTTKCPSSSGRASQEGLCKPHQVL